jgi:hypothetical protein
MTVLHSRSAGWALLAALVMCALAAVAGRMAIEIDLSARFPPTKLVMVELCVILSATLLAILTRPRFWEWDRIARSRRPRVVAGVTAAAVVALSTLCVPAVVPWLPTSASWTWVLTNALVLSASVQLAAALLNPLFAGALTIMFWLGSAVAANLAPHLWLPLAYYRELNGGRWFTAALLVAAVVIVHTVTCGATAWAHR